MGASSLGVHQYILIWQKQWSSIINSNSIGYQSWFYYKSATSTTVLCSILTLLRHSPNRQKEEKAYTSRSTQLMCKASVVIAPGSGHQLTLLRINFVCTYDWRYISITGRFFNKKFVNVRREQFYLRYASDKWCPTWGTTP